MVKFEMTPENLVSFVLNEMRPISNKTEIFWNKEAGVDQFPSVEEINTWKTDQYFAGFNYLSELNYQMSLSWKRHLLFYFYKNHSKMCPSIRNVSYTLI